MIKRENKKVSMKKSKKYTSPYFYKILKKSLWYTISLYK